MFDPVGDKIIAKSLHANETTEGGVILPDITNVSHAEAAIELVTVSFFLVCFTCTTLLPPTAPQVLSPLK